MFYFSNKKEEKRNLYHITLMYVVPAFVSRISGHIWKYFWPKWNKKNNNKVQKFF